MSDQEIDLKDLPGKGHISFFIKAPYTEENNTIHTAFRDFSKIEAADNYTMALKILLQSYDRDTKYIILGERIMELEVKVKELEDYIKQKEPFNKEKGVSEAF